MADPKTGSKHKDGAGIVANPHIIPLAARKVGAQIEVIPITQLGKGSGQHKFTFQIVDDTTGLNVRFKQIEDGMLDAKDGCWDCPPPAGMATSQIDEVSRNSDTEAEFVNKNDNKPRMPVSFQLHFECDDKWSGPITYDPIIINGGRN